MQRYEKKNKQQQSVAILFLLVTHRCRCTSPLLHTPAHRYANRPDEEKNMILRKKNVTLHFNIPVGEPHGQRHNTLNDKQITHRQNT